MSQYAGADGRVISLLLQHGNLDGLVVEGFGLGTSPRGTLEAIKEARVLLMLALTRTTATEEPQSYFDR